MTLRDWSFTEGNGVQAYCAWQERRQPRRGRLNRAWVMDASWRMTPEDEDSLTLWRAASKVAEAEFWEQWGKPPPKPAPLFELSI